MKKRTVTQDANTRLANKLMAVATGAFLIFFLVFLMGIVITFLGK